MPDEHDTVRTANPEVRTPETAEKQTERMAQADEAAEPQAGGLEPTSRYFWYLVPFVAVWVIGIAALVLYLM